MASKNGIVHGPAKPIATCPKSYKSSKTATYDGEPHGGYTRTKSSNAVPEIALDKSVKVPKD